ncbi:MAG TPA: hypothetical protein VES64_08310 [Allosphingosinicella sp.]|nr:hypothetical protein [Allosphingosinicella sp.]
MGKTIQIAALALLLLLGGALTVVVRQRLAAGDQATASPPPQQAIEKPPPTPAPADRVDLGSALSLDRLADCAREPALASILEQMVRIDPQSFESRRGGPISVPGYAQPITPTFERRREMAHNSDIREVTADLDLPGRWHGLAVTGLRRSFYEESDVASFEVRFAEPPERVRDTLVRHGFRLSPVGEFRELDEGEGITMVIGIDRIDGGAALTCATG